MRRIVAILVLAVAAFLLLGGLAGFVGLVAGAEPTGDLGRSAIAQISALYVVAGAALAWTGWSVWRSRGRRG